MNKFKGYARVLPWFMALILGTLLVACGGGQKPILGDGGVSALTTKTMTAYSLAGVPGTINETTKSIAVILPNGTNVTALVATFTSTGASVRVGAAVQTSAITANNFTSPVAYTVTAPDGSTATYTVAINVASNTAKALTAYSLAGVAGKINEAGKSIAVTLPSGTNVTALAATFASSGTGVKVGAAVQTSAITANNFTSPVIYTVTAADNSTATYTVAVTVASNTAKALSAYSLAGVAGAINETAKTITVTLPSGTSVTAQVATFTTSGTSVKVGATVQTSAITANDFTSPVAYTVIATDGSTATYNVTVTVAAGSAKALTTYSLAGIAGTINETAKTVTVPLPSGTSVTALVATFSTTGANARVATTTQISGATANDFTAPVVYTVTAADGSTAIYNVSATVAAAGPAPVPLGAAGNFVILAKAAVSTTGTTAVVGDIGVSPAAATYITGFGPILDSTGTFSTSSLVTGKVYAADYTPPTPSNMTTAVSNMETAYTDAAGRATPNSTELGAGNISGMTIVPGLYKWGTGVHITNAGVTLSGGANDVWIFQIGQDLTVDSGAIVTLSGGAQAKNVFWQVAGQATINTGAKFKGIILSQTQIVFKTGSEFIGRALAQTAVTLDATSVTKP